MLYLHKGVLCMWLVGLCNYKYDVDSVDLFSFNVHIITGNNLLSVQISVGFHCSSLLLLFCRLLSTVCIAINQGFILLNQMIFRI